MPDNTQRWKDGEEQSRQQKMRVETSWPVGSRELDDLARVAERIRGNPQRRGEASAYVIRLWSQVVNGELSPAAFWEVFGVTAQMPAQTMVSQSALPPATVREVPAPPPAMPEIPKAEERRANREKNRAAQADQWAN